MERDSVVGVSIAELDSATTLGDLSGVATTGVCVGVDEALPGESTIRSLAQPPIMSPRNITPMAFLYMAVPPLKLT
ncbi:MAG TPA: hypothetical protein VJR03_12230 [Nitrospira sp.]|nr:hypothetical protein [Nitrospira sp.]